jgi:hypothetical protein
VQGASLDGDALAGAVDGSTGAMFTKASLYDVDDVVHPYERGHVRFAQKECHSHSAS